MGFWALQIQMSDLDAAEHAVGDFGGDNRAGVPGTLHRISCIRNRKGGTFSEELSLKQPPNEASVVSDDPHWVFVLIPAP